MPGGAGCARISLDPYWNESIVDNGHRLQFLGITTLARCKPELTRNT
jgi:hypothetical protein